MNKIVSIIIILMAGVSLTSFAKDEEALEYKGVKTRKAACDIGVLYVKTAGGMDVTVAAVATGKGAEYRAWEPTDIKLDIDGDIIRPDTSDKFYGTKESIFRLPAAFVFAAIGSQYEMYATDCTKYGGVCFERGAVAEAVDKTGMAVGMGLLVSQAKGEITGFKGTFKLDDTMAKKLYDKMGAVKIVIENREEQKKERIKVSLSAAFDEAVKIPE